MHGFSIFYNHTEELAILSLLGVLFWLRSAIKLPSAILVLV